MHMSIMSTRWTSPGIIPSARRSQISPLNSSTPFPGFMATDSSRSFSSGRCMTHGSPLTMGRSCSGATRPDSIFLS